MKDLTKRLADEVILFMADQAKLDELHAQSLKDVAIYPQFVRLQKELASRRAAIVQLAREVQTLP